MANKKTNEMNSYFGQYLSNPPILFYEFGKEQCMSNKLITNYKERNYYTLHYIFYGKGTVLTENNDSCKEIELSAGDMFVISPLQDLKYFPNKNKPWLYGWVGINGEIVDHFFSSISFNANYPIIQCEKNSELADNFEKLLQSLQEDSFNKSRQTAYTMLILSYLSEKIIHSSSQKVSQKLKKVNEVKNFIECNYGNKITISDIANSVHINPNYLSNIFNEITGISTKQYLTQYRIQRACISLASTSEKIQEIALKVGYPDALHFSKEFRKIEQCSPLEYRKKHRF